MIGFYDSGVGGLSILSEFLNLNNNFKYVYFADNAFLPLGDKNQEQIINRITQVCTFLFESKKCNLVILACNTASVTTIRFLQQIWLPKNYPSKQILSITKPLIEYLLSDFSYLKSKKGLFLGTQATINSNFYQKELSYLGYKNLSFLSLSGLAEKIENHNDKEIKNFLKNTFNNLNTLNIEYIILGCTHYNFIKKQIQIFFDAKVIDFSYFVAKRLIWYLNKHPHFASLKKESNISEFVTNNSSINNLLFFLEKIKLNDFNLKKVNF